MFVFVLHCLCWQNSRGITHTDGNVDKTSVTLTWTAPSEGTGPVTFRYAGVVVRTMYWANQMGPMLNGEFSYHLL